jgi:mycothiol synthase
LGRALPPGYTVRPAALDDVEATVAMLNAASRALSGENQHTVNNWRNTWQAPDFNLAERTRLVLAADGALAGYAALRGSAPYTHLKQWGRVHPDHLGRGLGTYLVGWTETLARQVAAQAPVGQAVKLQTGAKHLDAGTQSLLLAAGFERVRHYLHMAIEFDSPPPAPHWPVGFSVRAFVPGPDDEPTYRAMRSAFRDSWDYVEEPVDTGFTHWRHRWQHDPEFDPSRCFLAVTNVDERIAGTVFCHWSPTQQPEAGWIYSLGVLREFRRQGLAQALLRHCFVELYGRGQRRAALGVDAASPTGATDLYEKAGMHSVEAKMHTTWEKQLTASTPEVNGAPLPKDTEP